MIADIHTVMASKQEDAHVEVKVVTEGMDGIIEGASETEGDSLMGTDEIIEVEVNKKGILLELKDDIS